MRHLIALTLLAVVLGSFSVAEAWVGPKKFSFLKANLKKAPLKTKPQRIAEKMEQVAKWSKDTFIIAPKQAIQGAIFRLRKQKVRLEGDTAETVETAKTPAPARAMLVRLE